MSQKSGLQPVLEKLVNQYHKPLQISLRIALLLYIIGLVLALNIGFNYLAVIGALASALLFFVFAFRVIPIDREGESESVWDSFGMLSFLNKLNYVALAISTIGILFLLTQAEMHFIMSQVGGYTILIISIFYVFIKQKPNGYLIKTELIIINLIFLLAFLSFTLIM